MSRFFVRAILRFLLAFIDFFLIWHWYICVFKQLETAYFTSKQSKKSFSSIEKCTSKIKVPQFLYCHYICMYVSVFATAYTVCASKLKFELGSLYMIISKCIFFVFRNFILFWSCAPFFIFHNFLYIKGMK